MGQTHITRQQAAELTGLTLDGIAYRIRSGQLTTRPDPADARRIWLDLNEVKALLDKLTASNLPEQ